MRQIAFAAALLLAATPGLAQDKPAAPEKPKKICKTEPIQTGQIMAHKNCRTAEQWAVIEEKRKNHAPLANDARREGLGGNNQGMRPPM